MRVPKFDPPDVTDKPRDNWITQVREYELITPLYGGGVDPHAADPVTVVRATEIRGHLRFWWRATRGGQFGGDLSKMKQAEDELFGCAAGEGKKSGQSQVQIIGLEGKSTGIDKPFEVVPGKPGRFGAKPKIQPRNGSIVPAYAAFSLQPSQETAVIGMETLSVTTGVTFSFEVNFPKSHSNDVEAAFWAWETFGGIGARTRRGFGAVMLRRCSENGMGKPVQLPHTNQIETNIRAALAKYTSNGKWHPSVPHLSPNMVFRTTPSGSALEVWRMLIRHLEGFRQYRKDKEGKLSRFGKSCWPEPKAIRQINWNGNTNLKFPRAHFGLPIGFHFPQEQLPEAKLRGQKITGKEIERLASPLILRPLSCSNSQSVGLAAILETPTLPLNGIELKELKLKVRADVSTDEAQHEPLKGNANVLLAFLNYLQEKTR